MKKILYIISLVLFFSSCQKEPEFNAFSVELTIPFDIEITIESVIGAKVLLNNLEKNYSYESTVDANGKVNFSMVEPGFYTATMSHQYINVDGQINFNAFTKLSVIEANVDQSLPVILSVSNPLIIKEFYFSGTKTPASKSYYSGQYVEIYNNSGAIQYADGLSIIEHESSGTSTSKWLGFPDKVVVKMIWTIPGNGFDNPIQPGESIVIARDAFDHKSDPLGNPLSPVDMGNADFEFWVDHSTGKDIDNHQVTNMLEELFTFRGTDIAFGVSGTSAIGLARISNNLAERIDYINNNLVRKPESSSTRLFCTLDKDMIVDAIEVVRDEARSAYKRFQIELDAGYTYIESGSKSGKCIRRKIKYIVNGRIVYQDTNNSTEDFLKDVDPKPWIYE